MPLKSKRQMRWMFAKHPRMARRWAEHTPDIRGLPERAGADDRDDRGDKEKSAMTLTEKVINAFQLVGAALEKAEKQAAETEESRKAQATIIPQVVEALVRNGCIDLTEKEAAARALADPVKALKILIKTAGFRADEGVPLGQPADDNGRVGQTKKASAVPGSTGSCYVGARTTRQKPSDVKFLRGLGLGHLVNEETGE